MANILSLPNLAFACTFLTIRTLQRRESYNILMTNMETWRSLVCISLSSSLPPALSPSEDYAMLFLFLTSLRLVYAGASICKIVRKTVQPRTGAGLRLLNFDLGPRHEWVCNDSTLSSTESTVKSPTELNYELSSMGAQSKEAPTVPESGHSWPRNGRIEEHFPESDHVKWIESKLAEGRKC